MPRHVQKSSLYPARINVAFPPPSQGTEDAAPRLRPQQTLLGKAEHVLDTSPIHFLLPKLFWGQQLRRNQTHVLWLEFPLHPTSGHRSHPASTPKTGAGSKSSCTSSFLTSLCFKALPGKVGGEKKYNVGFCAQLEHPGLPWGRGETDNCVFIRKAVKGLSQQSSIKGSSRGEGVEKLRWVGVAQTPWNLRNFPLLSHFPCSEGAKNRGSKEPTPGPGAEALGMGKARAQRQSWHRVTRGEKLQFRAPGTAQGGLISCK